MNPPNLVPTLVVGGEHSLIVEKLAPQLQRHGLQIAAHWEWRKKAGAFPDATQLVFVLTDMAGHTLNNAAVNAARERGLPVVFGGRKWALNIERLEKAGFPQITTPTSQPAPETTNMPANTHPQYPFYEKCIREDPLATNATVYQRARAAAEAAGVSFGKPRGDIIAAIRQDTGIRKYGPRKRRNAAPVTVATVPTSEVPPEVLAATPAAVQPTPKPPAKRPEGTGEIKDLVKLLRVVMGEENITHLTITPEGVTFRRLVVEEGSFDA